VRVFLALVLFVVSACSHTPRAQPTGLGQAGFWSEQTQRSQEVKLLSGKVRLSYQGRKQSVSGKGRLLSQLPAQARMELRDPLGRVAYVVALNGKKFTAYYPSQKRAFVGEDGGREYFKSSMGLEAGFDELQRMLLGLLPERAGKGPFPNWEWDDGKGAYRADMKRGDTHWHLFIDGKSAALRQVTIESPTETIMVQYSDYGPCCGSLDSGNQIALASTVQVTMDRAGTAVELQWEDIEKNEAPRGADSFQVTLPEDVKKSR